MSFVSIPAFRIQRSVPIQDLLEDGSPELLIDALSDKVSSITTIDRDEITPDNCTMYHQVPLPIEGAGFAIAKAFD